MHANLTTENNGSGPQVGGAGTFFLFVEILVLSLEIVVTVLALMGVAQIGEALTWHLSLCVLIVALAVVAEFWGFDSGNLQKFTFLMTVAGPIGAAAALIGEQLSSSAHSAVLEQWYNTIAPPPAPAITLADRILDDQLVRTTSRLPQRFDRLLAHGTMREKQAFFAHVAADSTQPAVSSLLDTALRSRDQRVRVQAAAVASFIRDRARREASRSLPSVTNAGLIETSVHHAPSGK